MAQRPSFSIIIPVLNEEAILADSIKRLTHSLLSRRELGNRWEIVLVENGSTDSTWDICHRLKELYPKSMACYQLPFASYGQAIKAGVLHAKHDVVVIFNADLWNITFLTTALSLISVCDVVVGSKTSIAADDRRSWARKQLSYWFNILLRILFNFPGTDTHGIKVLRKAKILPLVKKCVTLHELFDTELVLRACRKKYTYLELPISVVEVRPSRYKNWKRIYNTCKDMMRIFRYKYL